MCHQILEFSSFIIIVSIAISLKTYKCTYFTQKSGTNAFHCFCAAYIIYAEELLLQGVYKQRCQFDPDSLLCFVCCRSDMGRQRNPRMTQNLLSRRWFIVKHI